MQAWLIIYFRLGEIERYIGKMHGGVMPTIHTPLTTLRYPSPMQVFLLRELSQ